MEKIFHQKSASRLTLASLINDFDACTQNSLIVCKVECVLSQQWRQRQNLVTMCAGWQRVEALYASWVFNLALQNAPVDVVSELCVLRIFQEGLQVVVDAAQLVEAASIQCIYELEIVDIDQRVLDIELGATQILEHFLVVRFTKLFIVLSIVGISTSPSSDIIFTNDDGVTDLIEFTLSSNPRRGD